jgi:glycosyltransferase involved in cell wall biosynthesis
VRIGIDNISPGESTGLKAPGGMRIYLQSLIQEFAIQRPDYKFILFTSCWADPLFDIIPDNVDIIKLPWVPNNKFFRVLYQHIVYPLYINRQHCDVFFATATIAPLGLLIPIVLSVQFLQFYEFHQAYNYFRRTYLRLMVPLSLKKAIKVIIFTQQSKRDLIKYTNTRSEKISVIPHSLSNEIIESSILPEGAFERKEGFMLTGGRPYILYVSSTYGYKNHIILIKAFGLLKKRHLLPHVLLIVGGEVDVTFQSIMKIAQMNDVSDDVILTGRLEHRLTAALYLDADLSVFPSSYETFGFPILEAMACGCPVVASHTGIMEEVENAAVVIDPHREDSIADGMQRVIIDRGLRTELISRGRQLARNYAWEVTAKRTLEVLEQASRQ